VEVINNSSTGYYRIDEQEMDSEQLNEMQNQEHFQVAEIVDPTTGDNINKNENAADEYTPS
jgi:hypothetical protein